MIKLITINTTSSFPTNFSQVGHSIRQMERPPITTALVGVTIFTTPEAAQKIIIMTSGDSPKLAANPPKVGIDAAARPEVDGIKKDKPI